MRSNKTLSSRKGPTTRQVPARKTTDAKYLALLRRHCLRAAGIGAATAAAEAIPGLRHALGFVFGELLDAKFLTAIQRELVDDVFRLYRFKLTPKLHNALVEKVQIVGVGASVAGDAMVRRLLRESFGRAGSLVMSRALPIAPIVGSALSNAAVTYAIGKRAQAVARLRDAPLLGMPDVVRAFTGVDERRVLAWSATAVRNSLSAVGRAIAQAGRRIVPARK